MITKIPKFQYKQIKTFSLDSLLSTQIRSFNTRKKFTLISWSSRKDIFHFQVI